MNREKLEQAAAVLAEMHGGGLRPAALPAECQPADMAEAMAIQAALVRRLGEPVMGWKVGAIADGVVTHGAILRSRTYTSPATVPAASLSPIGIEAEIAFRFDSDAPPRDSDYGYDEVVAMTTPFVAIEIVSSRFASYADAPFLDRGADLVSNGGFVIGRERPDRRGTDLSDLEAKVAFDGRIVVRKRGGHLRGDPLLPAVELLNQFRQGAGVAKGQFMTTGTYSGIEFAQPGQSVEVDFEDFGSAALKLSG